MGNKYLDLLTQVVRQPRHPVSGERRLRCEILRLDGLPAGHAEPELLDFSRGGCCLRWAVQLDKQEQIALRICDSTSRLALELPGRIRWVRVEDDGRYLAGCQFDRQVDYEELGELFLEGFLSMNEATPK